MTVLPTPAPPKDRSCRHEQQAEQVDDLDAGFEVRLRTRFSSFGGERESATIGCGDQATLVDGFAEQIEHAAEYFLADRYGDRSAVSTRADHASCRRSNRGTRGGRRHHQVLLTLRTACLLTTEIEFDSLVVQIGERVFELRVEGRPMT